MAGKIYKCLSSRSYGNCYSYAKEDEIFQKAGNTFIFDINIILVYIVTLLI